jgi:RNA polymerase-binding transcription factor DksA
MDAEKLNEFKTRLTHEKDRLDKELAYVESTMDLPQSEWSGEDLGYDNHPADLGSSTIARERDESLARNVRDLLQKVSTALSRIDDGSFGICVVCGRPIEEARLEALPYTDLCLEDKKMEEKSW